MQLVTGLKLEARVDFYEKVVAVYGAGAVGCTVGISLDGSGPSNWDGTLDSVHHITPTLSLFSKLNDLTATFCKNILLNIQLSIMTT